MKSAVLSAFILLSVIADASAQTFPNRPPNSAWYVDEAGLIKPAEAAEINRTAATLFRDKQIPIVVVTITSLAAKGADYYTIERYASELFNTWGLGSKDRNAGMLLLVSKGDRAARIELGGQWAHDYDIKATQVMENNILPSFRKDNYSQGILAGVQGMNAMARGAALPPPPKDWKRIAIIVGVLVVGIAAIISLFMHGQKGWAWAAIGLLLALILALLRSKRSSGGSSGAFGGGSSGGGGATGRW